MIYFLQSIHIIFINKINIWAIANCQKKKVIGYLSSTMKDLSDTQKKKIQEIINNTENVPILADNFIGANIVRKFDWRENKILSCLYWYFHEKWNIFLLITNTESLRDTTIEYEINKIIKIPRQIFIFILPRRKSLFKMLVIGNQNDKCISTI